MAVVRKKYIRGFRVGRRRPSEKISEVEKSEKRDDR